MFLHNRIFTNSLVFYGKFSQSENKITKQLATFKAPKDEKLVFQKKL